MAGPLPNRLVLALLLFAACRRDAPAAKAPRASAEIRPGSVLIIENRTAVSRFLQGEGLAFDDVWTPAASAAAFLDAAVIRYLDSHLPVPGDDPDLESQNSRELSNLREHLGSYVRECAGFSVAGKRQIICQFVLQAWAIRRGVTSDERSFTIIMDGGCDVFVVLADVDRREIISLACNGVA
jgi:hypothetical protein